MLAYVLPVRIHRQTFVYILSRRVAERLDYSDSSTVPVE